MFIIDSNNHLVSAEPEDLKQWNQKDIYEAARAFKKGTLRWENDGGKLFIDDETILKYDVTPMESLLGSWSLCRLIPTEETGQTPSDTSSGEKSDATLSFIPLGIEEESSVETEETEGKLPAPTEETVEEEESIHALLESVEEEETVPLTEISEEKTETETETEKDAEVHDLLQPVDEEENPLILLEEESETESENQEITPEEIEELLRLSDEEEEPEISLMPLEEEETTLPEEEASRSETETVSDELLTLTDEIPGIMEEEEPHQEEETSAPAPITEEELTSDGDKYEQSEEDHALSAPDWEELAAAFHPDLHANAQRLELSDNEYNDLLREFLEDSRSLRNDLVSQSPERVRHAASILKDAVVLLHLHPLDDLIERCVNADADERMQILNRYDELIRHLEEDLKSSSEPASTAEVELRKAPAAEQVTAPAPETPEMAEEEPAEVSVGQETIETVEEKAEEAPAQVDAESFLEGVTPIPIEFSLHIAAQELNLPEDLVLEFINDFAKQGHEYLPVLIDAYQSGDLDRLQKTAHMLKGAASNLRVEAMVDNLYDLQFDNDIQRAPDRIRRFAGQLMSLDTYLSQMNS